MPTRLLEPCPDRQRDLLADRLLCDDHTGELRLPQPYVPNRECAHLSDGR